MHIDLRHLHLRKRKHPSAKGTPYPHPSRKIAFLDRVVLLVAIIGPLANIPQIMEVYLQRNGAGVSLASWTLYAVFNTIWIVYGIVHKERTILLAHLFWFITQIVVIVGVILYG